RMGQGNLIVVEAGPNPRNKLQTLCRRQRSNLFITEKSHAPITRLAAASTLSDRGEPARGRTGPVAEAILLRSRRKPWLSSRPFREIFRAFRSPVPRGCSASRQERRRHR